MTTIVTRAGKGSPLTNNEMDANLNNLNTDKIETSQVGVSVQAQLVSGTNIKTINSSSILGSGDLVVNAPDGNKGDITVSSSGTVWNINADSITAAELAPGALLETSPNYGIGYGPGAGGTVTQATSRATAVTLNKPSGDITMFLAAGNSAYSQFTVNNSTVSITDTISLSVRSAANVYDFSVQNMANGSFAIYFAAVVGTSVDAPIVHFNVHKGAVS